MKKILLFGIVACFALQAAAQSFTVYNTTSCDFEFACIGATPSCSQVDGFGHLVTILAGQTISYSSVSAAPWGDPPLPGLQWGLVQTADCNGAAGPLLGPGQYPCQPSYGPIGTGPAISCGCPSYTVTRDIDAYGNITLTFY